MHIIAFNGSPRKNGNTSRLLARMLQNLEAGGCSTELVHLGAGMAHGCVDCGLCRTTRTYVCCQKKDTHINEWFDKMIQAQGIILGSPVYVGGITPTMKAFVEKVSYLARGPMKLGAPYSVLRNKIGVAVTATRRSGGIQTLQGMTALFAHTQMIMPCAGYWPVSFGLSPGDCDHDKRGLEVVDSLTERMAWAVRRLNAEPLNSKEN